MNTSKFSRFLKQTPSHLFSLVFCPGYMWKDMQQVRQLSEIPSCIVHCSRCSIGGSHCKDWLIYFAGNITANEAEALLKHVEVALLEGPIAKAQPLFASQQRERRIVRLAPGYEYCYPTICLNPDDANSALINYFQVCQQPPLDSKIALPIISSQGYKEIRGEIHLWSLRAIIAIRRDGHHGWKWTQ